MYLLITLIKFSNKYQIENYRSLLNRGLKYIPITLNSCLINCHYYREISDDKFYLPLLLTRFFFLIFAVFTRN